MLQYLELITRYDFWFARVDSILICQIELNQVKILFFGRNSHTQLFIHAAGVEPRMLKRPLGYLTNGLSIPRQIKTLLDVEEWVKLILQMQNLVCLIQF